MFLKSHNEKSNNPLSHNQLKCTKLRSVAAGKEHYGHLFLALFCDFFCFLLFFVDFFFVVVAILPFLSVHRGKSCGFVPAPLPAIIVITNEQYHALDSPASASSDIGSGVPQTNTHTPVVALSPFLLAYSNSLLCTARRQIALLN